MIDEQSAKDHLYIVDGGSFLCDGGSIFGGVPKLLWSRQIQADERNLIRLEMRCLLYVKGQRKILIETGAGTKLSWKFVHNNGLENADKLLESLAGLGFSADDITDVVHTHLHWDHCGGGTTADKTTGKVVPTFRNAKYYCAKSQWDNALNANPREDDAYFENDLLPVLESGQLQLITEETELFPGFEWRIFDGHTPGMLVPLIHYRGKIIAYVSDLAPLAANVPLKWIAAYDLYPVTAMEEKRRFFREAFENGYILFFEHDTQYVCCTLKWDEVKGPMVDQKGDLNAFL